MEPLNVVLYQHDAGTARALAANLSQHFPSVYLTRNREEIRPAIARLRADVLVLDVESSRSGEVERLHQEFNSLEAQRECGEAYIRSQRQARWTLLPVRYDDGGYTGANLERPV